jgi:hypothetical protein
MDPDPDPDPRGQLITDPNPDRDYAWKLFWSWIKVCCQNVEFFVEISLNL